jgi:hypothetical protein
MPTPIEVRWAVATSLIQSSTAEKWKLRPISLCYWITFSLPFSRPPHLSYYAMRTPLLRSGARTAPRNVAVSYRVGSYYFLHQTPPAPCLSL